MSLTFAARHVGPYSKLFVGHQADLFLKRKMAEQCRRRA